MPLPTVIASVVVPYFCSLCLVSVGGMYRRCVGSFPKDVGRMTIIVPVGRVTLTASLSACSSSKTCSSVWDMIVVSNRELSKGSASANACWNVGLYCCPLMLFSACVMHVWSMSMPVTLWW